MDPPTMQKLLVLDKNQTLIPLVALPALILSLPVSSLFMATSLPEQSAKNL